MAAASGNEAAAADFADDEAKAIVISDGVTAKEMIGEDRGNLELMDDTTILLNCHTRTYGKDGHHIAKIGITH